MYREYLSHLDKIKKVMFDPVARKQEAKKAIQLKAEKIDDLRLKVRLLHVKAKELSESDLRHLVQGYMLSMALLLKRFLMSSISPFNVRII